MTSAAERCRSAKARRREGTKARRHEGAKARRREGTKARRHEGTKARRHEDTKARRHEGARTWPRRSAFSDFGSCLGRRTFRRFSVFVRYHSSVLRTFATDLE